MVGKYVNWSLSIGRSIKYSGAEPSLPTRPVWYLKSRGAGLTSVTEVKQESRVNRRHGLLYHCLVSDVSKLANDAA